VVALKKFMKKSGDIMRNMKKEMKLVKRNKLESIES
jgi:hypothetical protein